MVYKSLSTVLLVGLSQLSVAVWAANQAPEVRGQSETIRQAGQHQSWVWGQDPEGKTLTFEIVKPARHGKVTLDPKLGRYTYQPTQSTDYDEFSFRVFDGQLWSTPAPVQLRFTVKQTSNPTTNTKQPVQPTKPTNTNNSSHSNNQAPEARGQAEQLTSFAPHHSHVWAQDKDRDQITFQVVQAPKHGKLKLDSKTGRYTYTPQSNQASYDEFKFQATDGRSTSKVATVQLMLNFIDHKPTQPVSPTTPTTNNPSTPKQPTTPVNNNPTTKQPVTPVDKNPTTKPKQPKVDNKSPNKPSTPTAKTPEKPVDHYQSKDDFSANVKEVLSNDFFSPTFNHGASNRLHDVALAIDFLARSGDIADGDLDKLLYYIRAFNYYGNMKEIPVADLVLLNNALLTVTQMSDFYAMQEKAAAVQEGYVVAISGLFRQARVAEQLLSHIDVVAQLLTHYQQDGISDIKRHADSMFETLNIVDEMGYHAKNTREDAYKSVKDKVKQANLAERVAKLGASEQGLWQGKDAFVLFNAIEALGNLYLRDDADWNKQLDNYAADLVRQYQHYADQEELKSNFYVYYVNKTRYYDRNTTAEQACEKDFPGLCHIYKVDEVLPVEHTCSSTLKVKAQELTTAQLGYICSELKDMEATFHQKFTSATNQQPVADDNNSNLELVIFNSPEDWHKYGGVLFQVSTDNGGIYIEGDPSKKGNQARFYAYERHDLSEWQVWNLRHEYVHYLDSRFNQYGRFGHHPLQLTTWWAEGLAEYMAHGKSNKRGMSVMRGYTPARRPGFTDIAQTSYDKGDDMVYRWSYLLHWYLDENTPTQYLDLASALREKDSSIYKERLEKLGEHFGDKFTTWRDSKLTQTSPMIAADRYVASDVQPASVSNPRDNLAHSPLQQRRYSTARPPLRK
ncbi:collagenase [Zooshikella sp. RANM57]|uniref:collagenase n=1 Tax=Zooshikella sp. RANM57 TaxID=3425863 RepID=UPI003D6E724E